MVQKTIIDTLQKRVSQRGSLQKGVAVQGVLYQSILNAKFTGRKNLGRKRCTSNRDDRKLENAVKQSWFKHLGELHKEWTEAGVSASRVTTLRHLQENGYQTTSETETLSETCVERHRIHVAKSPVWSFHSLWWFGLPCHLLVLVHCVSMRYCQEEDERHQTQQCRWSKQPGLPLHLSSATGWLLPCHAALMQ